MAEMTCNLAETKPDSSDGRWEETRKKEEKWLGIHAKRF
jgi:hypothetical protein